MTPPHSWGFAPWVPGVGAALAGGGMGWALIAAPGRDRLVAVVLAFAGLLTVLAGLRLRHRLTADTAGLTVLSILGSRRLKWSDVESVTTVSHRRLGTTSALLEINLHDNALLAFSDTELGARSDEVAATLRSLLADSQF